MTSQPSASTPQPNLRPDHRRRARAYAVFAATVLGVVADLTLPLLRPSRHRAGNGASALDGGTSDD
ncbi:hypothetical protein [Streptomyces luteireticuli]|uniref:hypothetical protein n=1 Tax=Streptomyces luteireticuli TaxID=173858 RepID=UPI003558DD4C